MFEAGLVLLWTTLTAAGGLFSPTNWAVLVETPELSAAAVVNDPDTEMIVRQYLQDLATLGSPSVGQGVWIQTANLLLMNHQGSVPLPAASLTKIATSLAAVEVLGLDYRFETLIGTTGSVENGVVKGDLVVKGEGDPLFVWEEAIVLGNTLNRMGIRRVTGDLVIVGAFTMNYESDPMKAGLLLKQGLDSSLWSPEAAYQYSTLPAGTLRPRVEIAGKVRVARSLAFSPNVASTPDVRSAVPIVRHRSLSLRRLIKLMNIYSNNEMAEALARAVGGSTVVAQRAAQATGLSASEIQLQNGSGLGVNNRISPRAACALLMALQKRLQEPILTRTGSLMTVADLFPIADKDVDGTLIDRQIPAHAAVKTGTLNTVSALAGVFPTRDRGLIWFAIINRGTDIEGLRVEQDRLLQTLVQKWGAVAEVPPAIAPYANDNDDYLGNESRNEMLANF